MYPHGTTRPIMVASRHVQSPTGRYCVSIFKPYCGGGFSVSPCESRMFRWQMLHSSLFSILNIVCPNCGRTTPQALRPIFVPRLIHVVFAESFSFTLSVSCRRYFILSCITCGVNKCLIIRPVSQRCNLNRSP